MDIADEPAQKSEAPIEGSTVTITDEAASTKKIEAPLEDAAATITNVTVTATDSDVLLLPLHTAQEPAQPVEQAVSERGEQLEERSGPEGAPVVTSLHRRKQQSPRRAEKSPGTGKEKSPCRLEAGVTSSDSSTGTSSDESARRKLSFEDPPASPEGKSKDPGMEEGDIDWGDIDDSQLLSSTQAA